MCTTPILINKDTQDAMLVGCGKCMPCHIKYCNQWAFRFNIHYNENPIAHCVTLTYDNKNLPTCKKENRTYMTLVRAHTQSFFKKLRQSHKKRFKKYAPKISYIICGEYGDQFKRPHYHTIIFNAHVDDILKSWDKGSLYFGKEDVQATLIYTLKYTLKGRIHKYYHKNAPYEPPFMNVSKGIGSSLLKNLNKNNLPEIVTNGHIKTSLPRYYTKKLDAQIDTSKYRDIAIEKGRKHQQTLDQQGITLVQWRKMYHDYMWKADKKHMFNNEILMDIPPDLLEIINKNNLENPKISNFHDLEVSQQLTSKIPKQAKNAFKYGLNESGEKQEIDYDLHNINKQKINEEILNNEYLYSSSLKNRIPPNDAQKRKEDQQIENGNK